MRRDYAAEGDLRVYEVVGIVKNVRDGLDMVPANAPGVFYLPLGPADYARPSLQGMTLMVRAGRRAWMPSARCGAKSPPWTTSSRHATPAACRNRSTS